MGGAGKADIRKAQLFNCAQTLEFRGINDCGFSITEGNAAMNGVAYFNRHRTFCFKGFPPGFNGLYVSCLI